MTNLSSSTRQRYDSGGYSLSLASPINRIYTIDLAADYPMEISKVTTKLDQGTCTVILRINGTPVTGCSNISATSSKLTSIAVASNSVSVDDEITIEIANVTSVTDATIKVHTEATESSV
jgi:hypothetical protein